MKKIILIILMFISVNVFSQTLTTYYSFKTYPTSINKNIYWYGVNFSRIDSVLHLLATGSTSFDLTAFHSFSGINNFTNGTTFSDSVRMTRLSVDTLTITSGKIDSARIPNTAKIDTANYAHTTTGTTESFLSKVIFSALVTFQTTSPVFNIAAVFNVLQDFANGLTTTTLTASGTATFNGDVIFNGYKKNGASINIDKYSKDTLIRFTLSTTLNNIDSVSTGISINKVKSWSCIIKEDSSGSSYSPIAYYAPYAYYARLVGSSFKIEKGSSAPFKGDTAFISIRFYDLDR